VKPRFFAQPEDFRAWLAENHTSAPELLVGFYKRSADRSAAYAYEQRAAWEYFAALAPSYRHKAIYWVTSAAKPETRKSRLAKLIAMAAKKQKL